MIADSIKVPESEVEQRKYNWEDGILGLMDCGGSNLVKVDSQLRAANPLFPGVRIIATGRGPDHEDCKAREKKDYFAELNGVKEFPFVEVDFAAFEKKRGIALGDYFKAVRRGPDAKLKGKLDWEEVIQVRNKICYEFIAKIHETMEEYGIPIDIPVFAAGFMQLLSKDAADILQPENVHPGDVTKYNIKGHRRASRMIVGDGWIPPARAISAGHDVLYSSMHQLIHEMDAGLIYMRGYGLPIDYNYLLSKVDITNPKVLKAVGEAAQETLKHIGDHVIAGATFFDFFEGNWGMHKSGVLAYKFNSDWYLAPNGIMVEDHLANNPGTPFTRPKEFLEDKIKDFYKKIGHISKEVA